MEAVEIGDYVALPIPDVDRSVASAPNILCRIVDIDQHNLHELACRAGVLSNMFARNCFEKLESNQLNIEVKLNIRVTVCEAASSIDIAGGQGMLKCNCTTTCQSGRCSCKKAKLMCNSRCHHNNSKCLNK